MFGHNRLNAELQTQSANPANMMIAADIVKTLTDAVDRQRLIDTAIRLIAAPSWTGEAGKACECLAQILVEDGFSVERPTSGHESACTRPNLDPSSGGAFYKSTDISTRFTCRL